MNREIEISPYGSLLVFKKEYTAKDISSLIKEHKLRGLRIFAQLKDDRLPNLNFLSEYSFLEALDITSIDDSSFSFLNKLGNLRDLTINVPGSNIIDLSNQSNLENLTIHWRKGKILGLDKCYKLNSLCLIDYAEENFTSIAALRYLKDLKVKTSSVKNCKGIENLTELNSLLFGNCTNLLSLNGLEILNNLTSLAFDTCPLIRNYELLGYLHNLENLEITDCKGVSSIKFIEELPSLKKLSLLGNTDVLDGNVVPAKKVKEVVYKHRKHYNATIENKDHDNLIKNNLEKIKGLFKK